MKENIKKIIEEEINKIFNESNGEQIDVSKFSNLATEKVLDRIFIISGTLSDGYNYDFNVPVQSTEEIRKNTKIEYVDFQIEHKLNNNFKFNGSFSPDKTWLLNNGFYKAVIKIELESNVNNIEIDKLHTLISHELSHAYKYIKQLYDKSIQNSKTNKLNKINRNNNSILSNLLNNYIPLKEFAKMFYLSLPQEVDARVQETASNLNYINKKDYNETIEALGKYSPLNDARKMMNYNLNELLKTNENILKQFVDSFNYLIEKEEDANLKIINNTKSFFEYYLKFINNNGNRLYRNIMKLVANKHNLEENHMIIHMNTSLAHKILGEKFSFEDFIC